MPENDVIMYSVSIIAVNGEGVKDERVLSSCRLIYFLPLGGEVLLTMESNIMQL